MCVSLFVKRQDYIQSQLIRERQKDKCASVEPIEVHMQCDESYIRESSSIVNLCVRVESKTQIVHQHAISFVDPQQPDHKYNLLSLLISLQSTTQYKHLCIFSVNRLKCVR